MALILRGVLDWTLHQELGKLKSLTELSHCPETS